MPVTFIARELIEPQWQPVDLGDGASIEIAIARPSLEEQLQAINDSQGLSYQGYALASAIKDWRGVHDEQGNPIPYSWQSLNQLCASYPDASFALLAIRRQFLSGLAETERKNSPPPPVAGGTDARNETIVSTESSASGVISSD